MDEQSLFSTPSTEFTQSADSSKDSSKLVSVDLWTYERRFASEGFTLVAGVDEAGRGPLAGPVVAACAVVPLDFNSEGINDSKRLSPSQRETAYQRITAEIEHFGIGVVDSAEIDRINILRASQLAMKRAVAALSISPDVLLIDGLPVPKMAECFHFAIVGGDGCSVSIAAASIIAKVTRDHLMCEFSLIYPHYGFERHKGYGSAQHLSALSEHGPCPIHRRSFSPVALSIKPTLL